METRAQRARKRAEEDGKGEEDGKVWLKEKATGGRKKVCHGLGQDGAGILKVAVLVDNNNKDVQDTDTAEIEDILPAAAGMVEENANQVVTPVLVDLVYSDEEGEVEGGDVASHEELEEITVEAFESLTLAAETLDNDHESIKRKKPRQKQVKDKRKRLTNQLYFVPKPVLEKPSGSSASGRALKKREGFNTYDRLNCKDCGKTFHKAYGLSTHPCPGGLRG